MIINVNNIALFYEVSGTGAPLLLLHGNGEDHHIFDQLVDKLKAVYTVYAIDSRNHGQSEKTNDYDYDTMVADVYAFIKAKRIGPVNIIGFSDGAIVSLLLAMKHGQVIQKMALLGVNLKPDDFTAAAYQSIRETYEETKDPLFKLMLEQPNIELEALSKVEIPTFIVAAEDDVFKPETYHQLLKAFPNATAKLMLGHEHDSYIVHQDLLFPDFVQFFKS